MRVAILQLDVATGVSEPSAETGIVEAVDRALDGIETAAARGADFVVLPEQFAVGFFAFDRYEASAEPVGGPIHQRVADAAREQEVAVLAGTIVEDLGASTDRGLATPAPTGLANTAVLYDADGTRQLVYRKHHLFGHESAEARLLTPGERLGVCSIGEFTLGVTTCYDLRFPELYRRLVDRGADCIAVPSAWPYPRIEHWRTLGRARAIENLSYVVAANGVGTFPAEDAQGQALCGRSAVYDPWGTTVAAAGQDATVLIAELDPDRLRTVRASFPALEDRRSSK